MYGGGVRVTACRLFFHRALSGDQNGPRLVCGGVYERKTTQRIFCSQFCSQATGIVTAQWKPYEYMESENLLLNSIAA